MRFAFGRGWFEGAGTQRAGTLGAPAPQHPKGGARKARARLGPLLNARDRQKKMKTARESLLDVLEEAKGLLALQRNDFVWSGWDSREVALADVDSHIERVKKGDRTKRLELRVLFAPTGPIQEVSVSSGWGDEFLKLAARFDAAEKASIKGIAEARKSRLLPCLLVALA